MLPAEFLEDEKRVERFERQARAVALRNHPNVVQMIDEERRDHPLCFVMECRRPTTGATSTRSA